MSTTEPMGNAREHRDRAGKYLTFVLDNEGYGLEILKVREIIGVLNITPIPRTPEYVKGVINLRGKVIPIIDLRLKFGLPSVEWTDETCIIVVDVSGVELGIIVDQVSEVRDIADESIEDPPTVGVHAETDFILGIGKGEGEVTLLLDISRVLTQEDIRIARGEQVDGESEEAA